MSVFLKDYGVLIGPVFAFVLGVIAIYIKFYSDRQIESWKSRKKLRKLVQLIKKSPPPSKYYPQKSTIGFFHADQARNLTNISIFHKRVAVINSFIETIENDVLTNCAVLEIQQFHHLKFIISYTLRNMEDLQELIKNGITGQNEIDESFNNDLIGFHKMQDDYKRLITVCESPEKEFNYIEK